MDVHNTIRTGVTAAMCVAFAPAHNRRPASPRRHRGLDDLSQSSLPAVDARELRGNQPRGIFFVR